MITRLLDYKTVIWRTITHQESQEHYQSKFAKILVQFHEQFKLPNTQLIFSSPTLDNTWTQHCKLSTQVKVNPGIQMQVGRGLCKQSRQLSGFGSPLGATFSYIQSFWTVMLKRILEELLNPKSNKWLFLRSKEFLLAGQYCVSLPSSGDNA